MSIAENGKIHRVGSWKIVAVIFALLFVASLFVGLWHFSSVTAEPQFLEVEMATSGTVKLNVNQSIVLSARVLNDSKFAPYLFTWTYSVPDNQTVHMIVNNDVRMLSQQGNFAEGESVNASFPEASATPVTLYLKVKSLVNGACGYAPPVTLIDPYVNPNLYLDSLPSAGVFVAPDNMGWYAEINYTGKIVATSTNASNIISFAVHESGNCFLRSGTYYLDSPIVITNSCLLEGEGSRTTLDMPREINDSIILVSNATNVKILHISFNHHLVDSDLVPMASQKNAICAQNSTNLEFAYLNIENCYRSILIGGLNNFLGYELTQIDCSVTSTHDCYFFHVDSGVFVINGKHHRIFNNVIVNSRGDAIGLRGALRSVTNFPLDDAIIQGNQITNGGESGIRVEAEFGDVVEHCITNIKILDNTIENGEGTGIHLQCSTQSNYSAVVGKVFASKIIINGNQIVNATNQGIYCVYGAGGVFASELSISDNTIDFVNGVGIQLWSVIDSLVTNNQINNIRGTGRGMFLSGCHNCSIQTNIVKFCTWDCIKLYGSTNCIVSGNILESSDDGLYVSGETSNCTITNNHCQYNTRPGIAFNVQDGKEPTNNLVYGNDVRGNGHTGIEDLSYGNILENQIILENAGFDSLERNSTASAVTTIVTTNGAGVYQAVHVPTMQVLAQGNNAATVITRAASYGGTLFLSQGTYILESAVTVSTSCLIQGEGEKTVLTSQINTHFSYLNVVASQVNIQNIKFRGWIWNSTGTDGWHFILGDNPNPAAAGNNAGNIGVWIGTTPISGITVQNCFFENMSWGVKGIGRFSNIIVTGNSLKNMATAIQFGGNGGQETNIVVTDNTITNTADDAIAFLGSESQISDNNYLKNSVISGNTITHNTYYGCGIKLDCYGGVINGVAVTGNTIYNSSRGIGVWNEGTGDYHTPTNISITGNIINAVVTVAGGYGTSYGVHWVDYSGILASSNSILANNVISSADYGIYIVRVGNVAIQNNRISQSSSTTNRWNLKADGCSGLVVNSNTFSSQTSGCVYLLGSDHVDFKSNSLSTDDVYHNVMFLIENTLHVDADQNTFVGTGRAVSPVIMSGTSNWCNFENNYLQVHRESTYLFLGNHTYVRGNVLMDGTAWNQNQKIRMLDADGTMTGTYLKSFTYEPQSGLSVEMPISSSGLVQQTVNFTYQYPTGGAVNGGLPSVTVTLRDASSVDFQVTLWIDSVSATGFRINLNVGTPSADGSATVKVGWSSELPDNW